MAAQAPALLDPQLLARIEDASINASAPPQQLWMDGWLIRLNPGKAKRARCINAVAAGSLPLQEKLERASKAYREAGLPMVVRITPFTRPAGLEAELVALGFGTLDNTQVMRMDLSARRPTRVPSPLPAGTEWVKLGPEAYAQAVGQLRGSPHDQQQAHAQRLSLSPVPYQGFAIRSRQDHQVMACGQYAREADLVGLYDVFTAPPYRRQGLADLLCERMLSLARNEGAATAYLQVEADNHVAVSIYQRIGFLPGYAYHYRVAPGV